VVLLNCLQYFIQFCWRNDGFEISRVVGYLLRHVTRSVTVEVTLKFVKFRELSRKRCTKMPQHTITEVVQAQKLENSVKQNLMFFRTASGARNVFSEV
jgi:hypothetical protein